MRFHCASASFRNMSSSFRYLAQQFPHAYEQIQQKRACKHDGLTPPAGHTRDGFSPSASARCPASNVWQRCSLVAMASEWGPAQLPLDQLGVGRPKVTSGPQHFFCQRAAANIPGHSSASASQAEPRTGQCGGLATLSSHVPAKQAMVAKKEGEHFAEECAVTVVAVVL